MPQMPKARNVGIAGGAVVFALLGGIGLFNMGGGKDKEGKKTTPRAVVGANRVAPKKVALAPAKGMQAQRGTAKHNFTYVLRLRFIHPVQPDGKLAEQTISLEQLIKQGEKAREAKQEIHLKIRGDARAKWLRQVKAALKKKNVSFSVSNDF